MATKENPFSDPQSFCYKPKFPNKIMRATPAIINRAKGKLIACDKDGNALDGTKKSKPKGKGTKAPPKGEKETPGETDGEDGEGSGEEPKSDRPALEAEAKKLGISFRPNVKDETLRKKIEAAKA